MTARTQQLTIDADVVRQRRAELNMSERTLAARVGGTFSTATVRGIEAGHTSRDLTLRDAARIADALSLPVATILATPSPEPHGADQPPRGDLLRRTGALLASLAHPVDVDVLASVLDCDLESAESALGDLSRLTTAVGLEVRREGHAAALGPAFRAVPDETLQTVARQHLGRRGLDVSQALLLSRAVRGLRGKSLSNPERVTRGSLLNAGILRHSASGGVEVADDVRYSLLLDST